MRQKLTQIVKHLIILHFSVLFYRFLKSTIRETILDLKYSIFYRLITRFNGLLRERAPDLIQKQINVYSGS